MIDVNTTLAKIRAEADDKYAVSKDIGKEAAILYARIEKIHAANAMLDIVKDQLISYAISEELAETICKEAQTEFLAQL